jgi:predicted ABC-type ATPase
LGQADEAWIYDNSGAQPRRIGAKQAGIVTLEAYALPAVVTAVRNMRRT